MNVKPRTIFTGDNLPVLRGIEAESVDMVYADPPFSKGREFAAPIGSKAAGAMFRDAWTLNDIDVAWSGEIRAMNPAVSAQIEASGLFAGSSLQSYLTMMAVRLIEIRRILKPTGLMFLHCDTTAGAYLRVLCDSVFGYSQCRNEIRWGQVPIAPHFDSARCMIRYCFIRVRIATDGIMFISLMMMNT